MKRILTFGIVFLCFWSSSTYAQLEAYRYQRPLEGVTEQWHEINIPSAVFQHINTSFSDLRIYGITAQQDTIEAPYLLHQARKKESITEVQTILRNQSRSRNAYYYTFEIPKKQTINQMELQFQLKNFDWNVTVEGSHDQRTWYTLKDSCRIVSLHNELTDYEFTKLTFPDTDYQYIRLKIPSVKDPELRTAKVLLRYLEKGQSISYPIREWKSTIEKSKKQTEVFITLEQPVPINSVALQLKDSFDYYRPIALYYSRDSIQTTKGWKAQYRPWISGTLSVLSPPVFEGEATIAQHFKIVISNHDNPPLQIGAVQVSGDKHSLITRFTSPATYMLAYGNPKARLPRYDITAFKQHIPKQIPEVSVGEAQEIIQSDTSGTSPLFENKTWLWGAMLLIMALLVIFSLKMLKTK